jgi:hypothetical protein
MNRRLFRSSNPSKTRLIALCSLAILLCGRLWHVSQVQLCSFRLLFFVIVLVPIRSQDKLIMSVQVIFGQILTLSYDAWMFVQFKSNFGLECQPCTFEDDLWSKFVAHAWQYNRSFSFI